jgi:hypothetical protein
LDNLGKNFRANSNGVVAVGDLAEVYAVGCDKMIGAR